jgi:predicted RNase H-like nuclease
MTSTIHHSPTHIIGIDWAATDETKCGLALAEVRDGSITMLELLTGRETTPDRKDARSAPYVASWLKRHPDSLVAIDAPLGWPTKLAIAVSEHRAGKPLGELADAREFFTRTTDRHVHAVFGKSPLEIGADRIARTAFSALCLIKELRDAAGLPLRLAWRPDERGVIEVYPAATLRAIFGERIPPYKKAELTDARRAILERLDMIHMTSEQRERAVQSDHLLDAILCAIAGADFVAARAMPPTGGQENDVQREGWIWVREMTTRRVP